MQPGPMQHSPLQNTARQNTVPRDWSAWRVVLRPRWLAWHAFALVAFAGMLWLGQWQLRRALAGNELSWAYTFEWPLFAVAGAYFWVKTLREELQLHRAGAEAGANDAGGTESAPAVLSAAEEQAAAEAYAARLKAEVSGHGNSRHGKWRGWR